MDELVAIGMSPTMIQTRKKSGQLIPVLRGVFALPGTKLSEKGRAKAAVYASGRASCLSHRSALSLHGLVRERGPVHIVRKGGAGDRNGAVSVRSENFGFEVKRHQTRNLRPGEITAVGGIRTLTMERAFLGFAGEATDAEIGKALSQGERERTLCWETLRSVTENTGGVRGLGRLKREMDLWIPAYADAKSDPEEDFTRAIVHSRLPIPLVNQPLGDLVPDFLWLPLKLVVELDPYGTHNGYERFHRDRRKSVALERMGLRVIRFTWQDFYRHEGRTMGELREIMVQQAELLGVTNYLSI